MAAEAAAGMLVSNHSYGQLAGWSFGNWGASSNDEWYWWGNPNISQTEDYSFGFYNAKASQWDEIAELAPYYLIVKSAGNNRGQSHSGTHWIWDNGNWVSSTTTRDASGGSNGYDCIPTYGTAKNILTVGAVFDLPGGYSQPSDVVMTSFSSWGPTDDGRIKPDLVGNGVGLFSPYSTSDTAYSSISGTSMSSPNISGSLLLLQQHHHNLHNSYMRSATLKAIAIHTADEASNTPGPNYRFGWGLLNMENAAELISDTTNAVIIEDNVTNNQTNTYAVLSDGVTPIKVTLCWTDPHAAANTPSLNPTNSKLINDLDVRIYNPADTTVVYQPWILNPAIPTAGATKGDNFRDNVEVIDAGILPVGNYEVVVSHKGILAQASDQDFSLIISGATDTASPMVTALPWTEDFSNGLSGWTTNGTTGHNQVPNANAVWEYRGPNTTPSNTVGSRGAYSATTGPIISPTDTNGFVIFDSDYLDNAGVTGAFGTGPAPSPHAGSLISPSFNFSGYNNLVLRFHSLARNYDSDFLVALSNDDGLTWFDTITVFNLGVNASSGNQFYELNISVLGNESQARFKFVMKSNNSMTNTGYYFWMVDDIEVDELPAHDLIFYSPSVNIDKSGLIMDNDSMMAKKLTQTLYQARPYNFQANAYNFGHQTQTNVFLSVLVKDQSGSVVDSLNSQANSSVLSSTAVEEWNLRTPSWLPTAVGEYLVEYRLCSDSISFSEARLDTLRLLISDSLIGHVSASPVFNQIGTPQIADDGAKIAVHINLDNQEFDPGYYISLGSNSAVGGEIEIEIFHRTGIQPSFASPPLAFASRTLTTADINNGYISGNFTISTSGPVVIPPGEYWLIATLFSASGSSPVTILNDQRVHSPIFTSAMYLPGVNWYSSFTNSRTFNSPALYLVGCPDSAACTFIDCSTLSVTTTVLQPVTCFGDSNGVMRADVTGGTPPYQYAWTGSFNVQYDSVATGLSGGFHQVTVTDANNCTASDLVMLPSPNMLIISVSQKQNESCVGENDGMAQVSVSGGVSPYNVSWNTSPIQTGTMATGLPPGTYIAEVTDNNGCVKEVSVTIDPANVLMLDSIQGVGVSGAGQTDVYTLINRTNAQYTWDVTGGSIASGQGTSSIAIIWNQLGSQSISAEVIHGDSCGTTSRSVYIDENFSITNQHLAAGVRIYPNPSRGVFFVEVDNPEFYERIQIYDLEGKTIMLREVFSEQQIDLSRLSSGVYVLQLGTYRYRLIRM